MYGITIDYEYSETHKRQRIVAWSGSFYSVYEAEGYSLPGGNGYMLTTYNGDKVRVACPIRDADTFEVTDQAIRDALDANYAARGVTSLVQS